ncbi:MAG TPA: glycosyltransferase 87 family protein [Candidatus Dormibacteraeota bacterium]|nr:glycosyltransferase 87 family protein [Candidatus Dormibacteraeota bacterium]
MTALRRLFEPVEVGTRKLPGLGLLCLAAIGLVLLAVVAAFEWTHFNDEHAYWLAGARLAAGQPLYDPTALPNTPFAYWYPPPLAQVLAPITSFLSADAFSVLWTALLLVCLWWLGGRNVLVALALIAFLPVAVELRVRNVHLLIAVCIVLALRRSWVYWIPAAAIKITPGLGVVYLAAAGRWRDAVKVAVMGLAVLGVSVALGPGAWREFLDVVGARAGTDGGSLVAIPFVVRFGAGVALAVVAGLVAARAAARGQSELRGEVLLVIGLTVANPTLWATAFSLLIAIVPLWRSSRAPAGVVAAAAGASSVKAPATAG